MVNAMKKGKSINIIELKDIFLSSIQDTLCHNIQLCCAFVEVPSFKFFAGKM